MSLQQEAKRQHNRLVVGWCSIGISIGILLSLVLLLLAGF